MWTTIYFPKPFHTNGQETPVSRNCTSVNPEGFPTILKSNYGECTQNGAKLHFVDDDDTSESANRNIDINRLDDNPYLLSFSDQNVVVNELDDSLAKIDFVDQESEHESEVVDEKNFDGDDQLKLKSECKGTNLVVPPLSPRSIKEYSKRLENVFDVDGLVKFIDPIQSRLRDIRISYHSEINHLREQLENTKPGLDSRKEVVREQLTTVSINWMSNFYLIFELL